MNHDLAATLAGILLAAIQGAAIDFGKLGHGDRTEIVRVLFAILTGILGVLTKFKSNPPQKTIETQTVAVSEPAPAPCDTKGAGRVS